MSYKQITPLPIQQGGSNRNAFTFPNGCMQYVGSALNSSNLLLSAANVMTNGSQPAFYGYSAAGLFNVTGNGTALLSTIDTVPLNRGFNLVTISGVGYAFRPTVGGKYFLFMNVTGNNFNVNHTTSQILFTVGTTDYNGVYVNPFKVSALVGGTPTQTSTFGILLDVSPGTTINFKYQVSGGTKVVSLVGGQQNTFGGGFLVC